MKTYIKPKFVDFLLVFSIFLLSVSLPMLGWSQTCKSFYKSSACAIKGATGFKQYGQAKSALLESGRKYKSVIVLYGKKEYMINVCSEKGQVHYIIINKADGSLLYDNETDNYDNFTLLTIEKTMNVEFEVELLMNQNDEDDPIKYRICSGIQILWHRIMNVK